MCNAPKKYGNPPSSSLAGALAVVSFPLTPLAGPWAGWLARSTSDKFPAEQWLGCPQSAALDSSPSSELITPVFAWRRALGVIVAGLACGVAVLGAQPSPAPSPAAVIQQEYAALNRHDVDGVFAVYSDSIRYGEMRDSALMRPSSKAALRASLVPFLAQNPHGHVVVLHQITLGPFVIADQRMTGTANGRPYEILDLSEVQHGRVVAELETGNLTAPAAVARQTDSVARLQDDAFARGDPSAAAAPSAVPLLFHVWGEDSVRHMTHEKMIQGFHDVLAANPHMKYVLVESMVVGHFWAEHERLTGMANGKSWDAWDVREIRDGHVVAEWESPWQIGGPS